MAWISTVPPAEATGLLKRLYAAAIRLADGLGIDPEPLSAPSRSHNGD